MVHSAKRAHTLCFWDVWNYITLQKTRRNIQFIFHARLKFQVRNYYYCCFWSFCLHFSMVRVYTLCILPSFILFFSNVVNNQINQLAFSRNVFFCLWRAPVHSYSDTCMCKVLLCFSVFCIKQKVCFVAKLIIVNVIVAVVGRSADALALALIHCWIHDSEVSLSQRPKINFTFWMWVCMCAVCCVSSFDEINCFSYSFSEFRFSLVSTFNFSWNIFRSQGTKHHHATYIIQLLSCSSFPFVSRSANNFHSLLGTEVYYLSEEFDNDRSSYY